MHVKAESAGGGGRPAVKRKQGRKWRDTHTTSTLYEKTGQTSAAPTLTFIHIHTHLHSAGRCSCRMERRQMKWKRVMKRKEI